MVRSEIWSILRVSAGGYSSVDGSGCHDTQNASAARPETYALDLLKSLCVASYSYSYMAEVAQVPPCPAAHPVSSLAVTCSLQASMRPSLLMMKAACMRFRTPADQVQLHSHGTSGTLLEDIIIKIHASQGQAYMAPTSICKSPLSLMIDLKQTAPTQRCSRIRDPALPGHLQVRPQPRKLAHTIQL